MTRILAISILLSVLNQSAAQTSVRHFIFFGNERERIHEADFLTNKNVVGAQLKYSWRELEPEKDRYNLALIEKDLEFLTSKGKKLFVQVQDVTFDTARAKPVPDYLITDKQYHGGVSLQYTTTGKDEISAVAGYVARRWDNAVSERFSKLLSVLGSRFDGEIEGINLPETSVEFGNTGKLYPSGFSPENYRNAMIGYMTALRKSFQYSVVIQYANFMPGEYPHRASKLHLDSLYKFAAKNNIGMGGPDILVYQQPHMNHSYKFLRQYADVMITGCAVQEGNYEIINPSTGSQVTVNDIYDFACQYLQVDYIFWGTQEPFYKDNVLPFLKTVSDK